MTEKATISECRETISSPLRIVVFSNEPVPTLGPLDHSLLGWRKTGGDGVVAEMQTRMLIQFGHQAKIMTPTPVGILSQGTNRIFLNSDKISRYDVMSNPLGNVSLITDILRHLAGVQIVYTHSLATGAILASLKSSNLIGNDIKLVHIGHTWSREIDWIVKGKESPYKVAMEKVLIQMADRIVVATNFEAEFLAIRYSDSEILQEDIYQKTRVVPLGVDIETYNPEQRYKVRKRNRMKLLKDLSDSLNFFMVAGINPLKGQFEVVRAFCKVLTEYPDTQIVLSLFGGPREGKEEYYKEILSFVEMQKEQIRRRILFFGIMPSLLACGIGDVFVGPSSTETWYLAATEAMACGIPSILSDIPILKEVSQGSSHFVPPLDVDAIAEAMVLLIHDEDYRALLAEKALARGQGLSWEKSTRILENVFYSLV
ncbi:glycosyltransferase family 4 protein [Candidatus Dojkabacteria bacterium]|uniref:Glycosyltransferase family 4 protein n=1 Tax=Candidatus Dojkabacteria bacterium TaxID=2099670 RepID=A0A955L432_9BACT|nr:glycosyltransferase family 4 protein [Candidatus Dojkabacteria bacterium]